MNQDIRLRNTKSMSEYDYRNDTDPNLTDESWFREQSYKKEIASLKEERDKYKRHFEHLSKQFEIIVKDKFAILCELERMKGERDAKR
jgi:hypothetical protein